MAEISPRGARRIYRVLYDLATCDKQLAPAERDLLERFQEEHGLGPDEVAALEREEQPKLYVGAEEEERTLLIRSMVELAAADGVLTRSEERRLLRFAEAIGLPKAELRGAFRAQLACVERAQAVGAGPRLTPDERCPGFRDKPRLEHPVFELYIVASHKDQRTYARYEGGEDSQSTYERTFLIPPRGRGRAYAGHFALLEVRCSSCASPRFDSSSLNVWCRLDGGERMSLRDDYDYEKYDHALDHEQRGPLRPLRDHLRWCMGYDAVTKEDVQGLVSLVARSYY